MSTKGQNKGLVFPPSESEKKVTEQRRGGVQPVPAELGMDTMVHWVKFTRTGSVYACLYLVLVSVNRVFIRL